MVLETLITRRPVFDERLRVYGYELLYRASSDEGLFASLDPELGLQRLVDGLLTIGPAAVTDGCKGIVHATRGLLTSGALSLLPPESTVVALLPDVAVDEEVALACQALHEAGTGLALHRYRAGDDRALLLDLVGFVGVDLADVPAHGLRNLVRGVLARGVTVIADRVDTVADLQRAAAAGCTLFSGDLLARPAPVGGRQAQGFVRNYTRLLAAVNEREPDLAVIESVIKADVALSYKFLKYMNGAAFGWRERITSIRHGLVLLGNANVRRWVSLAAMAGMASTKPSELVVTSVIRARFCESLGVAAGLGDRSLDLFSIGMFSMIDAILDQPLDTALAGVALADDAVAALHGTPNDLGAVLEAVLAYEAAEWERLAGAAARLGLDEVAIPGHYLDALGWAEGLLRDTAAA